MINFRDRERSKRVVKPLETPAFEEPVSMIRSVRAEMKRPAPKITERQLMALIVVCLVVGTGIILAVLQAVRP